MNIKLAVITTSIVLSAACGEDDGDSEQSSLESGTLGLLAPEIDLSGSFDYFGFIDVTEDTFDDVVKIDAGFQEFTQTQEASVFVNSIPQIEDTCSGRVAEAIPSDAG